jgi:hypothetical protein|tara:strand:+ start:569 stop:1933 length:1365 start_codon:yes stop_codon:yes gene_type:complete
MTHSSKGLASLVVFFLVVVAALSGCKKPDSSIGLGLQPESDMLALFTDDSDSPLVTVRLVTVREDSLATDELSTGVLGRVYHPRFGLMTASFVTQLRLNAPNINFGENAVADSMYLTLKMTGDAYGSLTPHSIMVTQLTDTLVLDSTYYSNYIPETAHINLLDPSQPQVSLNPAADVIIGEDTVTSQVRLKMSNDFAQTLLNQDTTTFSSNEDWLKYFPGVHISSMSGQGATGIDISSGLSTMRLHYHNDTDTSFYDFVISPLSARVNLFSQEFDGALSELNSPETDTSFVAGDELLYVMSGSGVKMEMYIDGLDALNDSLGPERAVLKAELILHVDEHFYSKRYPAPEQLFIMTEDEDGEPVSTPDQYVSSNHIGGVFNPETMEYRFNISRTVQHLLNRESDYDYGYGNFSPDRDVPPLHIVSTRAGISIQGVVIRGSGVDENHARLVVTCSH